MGWAVPQEPAIWQEQAVASRMICHGAKRDPVDGWRRTLQTAHAAGNGKLLGGGIGRPRNPVRSATLQLMAIMEEQWQS